MSWEIFHSYTSYPAWLLESLPFGFQNVVRHTIFISRSLNGADTVGKEHEYLERANLPTIHRMFILSLVNLPRNKRSAVFFITSVVSTNEKRAISSNSFVSVHA